MLFYLMLIETQEDQTKFEMLYMRYRGLMFTVADKILNNKWDSEDAVHLAFVKVAEHIKKIDVSVEPVVRGYLVTIATNKAIDIYRKKRRRQRREVQLHENIGYEYKGENPLTFCLFQLPQTYKEVLSLKILHGYTAKEIAKMLDMTEANVHKTYQRAKKKLVKLYTKEMLK